MAHSISSKKRIRQNAKRNARNRWRLRSMRDAIKTFLDKIMHGTEAEAGEAFKAVSKLIDRTAAKGTIHKNQAARRKSRLAKRLKAKASGTHTASAKSGAKSGAKSAAKVGGAKSAASKSNSAKAGAAKPAKASPAKK